MREINQKPGLDVGAIQQPKQPAKPEVESVAAQPQAEAEKTVKDFSNPTAEALGRSQVGQANALQKDVAFGMKHPQAIENADKFFDMAYAQLKANNEPHAYEKACELASSYVNEFDS